MKILISSSNKDKLKEIKEIIGDNHELVTKDMIGLGDFDVVEDGQTLNDNALLKAKALYEKTKMNVLADDTGLFVDALDGAPGVYTARFAGDDCSYQDNVNKMLKIMEDIEEMDKRRAQFMTSICFIKDDGKIFFANGRLDGYISREERGTNGFGYDSIFIPAGHCNTLAELGMQEKNKISHRKRALENVKKLLGQL